MLKSAVFVGLVVQAGETIHPENCPVLISIAIKAIRKDHQLVPVPILPGEEHLVAVEMLTDPHSRGRFHIFRAGQDAAELPQGEVLFVSDIAVDRYVAVDGDVHIPFPFRLCGL